MKRCNHKAAAYFSLFRYRGVVQKCFFYISLASVGYWVAACGDNPPSPAKYTVTFHSNGGSAVPSQQVESGQKASKPDPAPTRDLYSFVEWCTDSALQKAYNFDTPVKADFTLFAKWEIDGGVYDINLVYQWRERNHGELPDGAYFGSFFAVVHNDKFSLYEVGKKLSAGMGDLAETGDTAPLGNEIRIAPGVFSYTRPFATVVPEAARVLPNVEVPRDYSYISIAFKIGPSPDWFVGVSAIQLKENGTFKSEVFGNMDAYDGGTEEGTGFSEDNDPTRPLAPVTRLDNLNGVPLERERPLVSYQIVKQN